MSRLSRQSERGATVLAMGTTNETAGHAFISYVREDADRVKDIVSALKAADIPVWTDKTKLSPGEDWKLTIRKAIQRNALAFIAVFSKNSQARDQSYQHEELSLAVEQLRQHPPGRVWLIPVRLDDCELPDYDLGPGRALDSLQRVDLFGDEAQDEKVRLVAAVLRILGEGVADSAAIRASITQADQRSRGAVLSGAIKSMLMEPSRQIELSDLVQTEAARARTDLTNTETFPGNVQVNADPDGARAIVARFNAYWDAVEPLAAALVTGCAWGNADQTGLWTQAVRAVASTLDGPKAGNTYLLAMQGYPVHGLVYAAALGAMARNNYASLKAVTVEPKVRHNGERNPVVTHMAPYDYVRPFEAAVNLLTHDAEGNEVADDVITGWMQRGGMRLTPVSDHFHALLAPLLKDLVPDPEDYSDLFDETEIMMGLLAADAYLQARKDNRYVGKQWYGRFTWKYRHSDRPLHRRMQADFEEAGANWPPLKVGMFGGSTHRATAAFDEYGKHGDNAISNRW